MATANVTFLRYGDTRVNNQVPPLAVAQGLISEDLDGSGGGSVTAARGVDGRGINPPLSIVRIKVINGDMRISFGDSPTPSASSGPLLSHGDVWEVIIPNNWQVGAINAA